MTSILVPRLDTRGVRGVDASNKLADNDVTDFAHAMALVQLMCLHEREVDLRTRRQLARDLGLPEPDSCWVSDGPCEVLRQAAKRALEIHNEELDAADARAAERMRAEGLGELADALESGDYRGLAV